MDYLVNNDCPPADASPAALPLYRWCATQPLVGDDFRTAEEEGTYVRKNPCNRKSVSVMSDRDEAIHYIGLFPWKNYRYVAVAELDAEHGPVKHTPGKVPSHTSWWPQGLNPIDRAALFRVDYGVHDAV